MGYRSDIIIGVTKEVYTASILKYEQEQYGFLRIGKVFNDVEKSGDPYHFGISFNRSIDYPGTE